MGHQNDSQNSFCFFAVFFGPLPIFLQAFNGLERFLGQETENPGQNKSGEPNNCRKKQPKVPENRPRQILQKAGREFRRFGTIWRDRFRSFLKSLQA